jgi:hypothetical protein
VIRNCLSLLNRASIAITDLNRGKMAREKSRAKRRTAGNFLNRRIIAFCHRALKMAGERGSSLHRSSVQRREITSCHRHVSVDWSKISQPQIITGEFTVTTATITLLVR